MRIGVEIDDEGRLVRTASAGEATGRPIARLRALAWRAADRRLASVDSPFWFVKLKGPAAAYLLEGTGMDLERLGLTPDSARTIWSSEKPALRAVCMLRVRCGMTSQATMAPTRAPRQRRSYAARRMSGTATSCAITENATSANRERVYSQPMSAEPTNHETP
jgi:hypothetical protein